MPLGATRFGLMGGKTEVSVEYLVISGGGGASQGGGGAGGISQNISSASTHFSGDTLTITVGAGGSGGAVGSTSSIQSTVLGTVSVVGGGNGNGGNGACGAVSYTHLRAHET